MSDTWAPKSRTLSTELEKLGPGCPMEPLPRYRWPSRGVPITLNGITYQMRVAHIVGDSWQWSTHLVTNCQLGTTRWLAEGRTTSEVAARNEALDWVLRHGHELITQHNEGTAAA